MMRDDQKFPHLQIKTISLAKVDATQEPELADR